MSRKKWYGGLALFGCVVAGVLYVALWPRTPITRENVARIQPGMDLAEVEAILGGPARNDATGPVTWEGPAPFDASGLLWGNADEGGRYLAMMWGSDEVLALVRFDARTRGVVNYETVPVHRVYEGTLLGMFRRLLRL